MISHTLLSRIYWLTGATCSGKTTISNEVGRMMQWAVYHCDDHGHDHRSRSCQTAHPNFYSYSRLHGDQLWLQPVDAHIRIQESACDEELELVLEDLTGYLEKQAGIILYDGYISPRMAERLRIPHSQIFYLIASNDFLEKQYAERPWVQKVLATTSDPGRAWANWMRRDTEAARILESEVQEGGYSSAIIDGSRNQSEILNTVLDHFRATQQDGQPDAFGAGYL